MCKYSNRLLIKTIKPKKAFSLSTQFLLLAALLFNIETVNAADQFDCNQARRTVAENFSKPLPADPNLVNKAFILRREGEVLCRQGDFESGLVKLNQAILTLNPDAKITAVVTKQGESDE